jgi:hypothetical protein
MLEYEVDPACANLPTRFGHIVLDRKNRYAMPATAPTPRMRYEAESVTRLKRRGMEVPCVIVPLSTRVETMGELSPILSLERGQTTLIPEAPEICRPIVLPDLESEAFAYGCDARIRYASESNRPKAVSALLKCGLTAGTSPGKERLDTITAWRTVGTDFGYSSLVPWLVKIQERARSAVFFAPSEIIRADAGSAKRSLETAWQIADVVTSDAFQGRGVHLLIHSELFLDHEAAMLERRSFLKELASLHASRNPRDFPFISIKIVNQRHYLQDSGRSLIPLGHLKDFLCEAAEHVKAARGILILQNFGPLSLAPLNCGVDVVGFRGTGRALEIDPLFGERTQKKPIAQPGRPVRLTLSTGEARPKSRKVPLFDPVRLVDISERNLRSLWGMYGATLSADHVETVPFPYLENQARRREFRTDLVTASLLAVGKEFREAGHGETPLSECVRDRVGRMALQDSMQVLCPAFETTV